jgi:4'-phosphopantetheinyl transferase
VLARSLNGACDVWSISLLQTPHDLTALECVLSDQERTRAAAFLRTSPRRQYIVARAALRTLLGRYLDVSPSALGFALNANGKPSLQPASRIRFNVSHAGDMVLIAISDGVELGVDVEAHRWTNDLDSLAASILCPPDLEHWRAAAAEERTAEFFRIWTCKEAMSKAIGCGMAMDFRSLRIRLAPGRAATLASVEPSWGRTESWFLQELNTGSGYSAAIAASASSLEVRQHTWDW